VWDATPHKPTACPTRMDDVGSSALSGGSPRRLHHHAGKWVLEVVRHVNLGQDLIRPTTQRLTGQRAISDYFKSNPDKALLAKATQRLMQGDLGGQTRSFNVEGEDWIANSSPPPPREYRLDTYRPAAPPPTIETEVSELKAQVVILTAVQEGLLQRLARLEAKLADGTLVAAASDAAVKKRRGARGELRPEAREELDEPESMGDAPSSSAFEQPEEPASEQIGSSVGGSEAEEEQQPEPVAASDAVQQVAAPPKRLLLTLPPVSDLVKCVALLVGGDVSAQEADEPTSINRTSRDCYCTPILDDHDQTVGMILMDLKATVCLGGTLMMLPKMELDQQLKTLSPGEDSIAASAEICNALSGAINGAQDQHVRVGTLEKFEFKAWSWVAQPADRRDLQDSFGGRTVVFAKPVPESIG
jgi:hypothetical protein